MSNEAEQRIYEAAAREHAANLRMRIGFEEKVWAHPSPNAGMPAFGSPIERLFFIALASVCHTLDGRYSLRYRPENGLYLAKESPGTMGVGFQCQYPVAGKRVDFAIFMYRLHGQLDSDDDVLSKSSVAVECDGHAYHHGDPVAAAKDKARDRILAEHFDAILRFTGSELHADAYSCAKQALKVAEAKLVAARL